MQHHIDGVVSSRVLPGNAVVEVETEKGKLPKVKRIEKVRPLSRVRDVGVIGNQHIIKMIWVVERGAKKEHPSHEQCGRDSASLWVIA